MSTPRTPGSGQGGSRAMDLPDTAPSGRVSGEVQSSGHDLREEPIGELLKRLSNETTTLVKQEIDLLKAELAAKAKPAGIGAGMFGSAGLFGLGAFLALTAFFIALLDAFRKRDAASPSTSPPAATAHGLRRAKSSTSRSSSSPLAF